MNNERIVVSFAIVLAACGGVHPGNNGVDGQTASDGATNVGGDVDASTPGSNPPTDGSAPSALTDANGTGPVDAVAPTPAAQWAAVTSNLAGLTSECGNVNGVFPNPKRDELIAGIARQGLWASTDGAATWHKIGTTGDMILNRASSIVWDPTSSDTFWESGIYGWENPFTDGVFMTTNNGTSFKGYATLATIQSHNDSVAIDFTDPARKTMLSGGHEQKQTLFLSTDAGATWSNIGMKIPDGLGFCTTTAVVDSKTFLVGCAISWSSAAGAILRSTDGGNSFQQVNGSSVTGQPLRASDGAIYWAVEGGGIMKSTDNGATWKSTADNNTAGSLPPIELPDGRIVSTHGSSIVLSGDKGMTWKTIGTDIPFQANGFSYSAQRSEFFAWYFTCAGSNDVPADSIQRFGWDYRMN